MAAEYPGAVPSFSGMVGTPNVSAQNAPSQTALFQKLADEVAAIAAELGISPSAAFATVLARLASMDTATTNALGVANAAGVLAAAAQPHDADLDTLAAGGAGATTWLAALLNGTYVPVDPTLTITYNGDGTVASIVENGVTTTFTYNSDGTVATSTRGAAAARVYTYSGGNLTSVA